MRRILPALLLLISCTTTQPTQPVLTPLADGENWMLERSLRYDTGRGDTIIVPAGFVTDFASVPNLLCNFLPASGRYLSAAIVHDFLYWDQTCTRDEADQLFLQAMNAAAVPRLKKETLYAGARLGGAIPWQTNTSKKSRGYIQVLPPERRRLPDETWSVYQQQLQTARVKEPEYKRPTPAACAAASLP